MTAIRPILTIVGVVVLCVALWFALAVVDDLRALKADIRAVRVYLMALPAPQQCPPPSTHEYITSCYYRLQVTEDKGNGLYRGKTDPKVYEEDMTHCADAKKTLAPQFKDLPYDCPKSDDQPGKDAVYSFQVGSNTVLEVGKPYAFESVAGTNLLRKIDKKEKES